LNSTIYEFNEAAGGFNRKREREIWDLREILWQMIQGNPHIKPETKPKIKSDIFKLSSDEVKKKVKRTPKVTASEIKVFEVLNYNKK
jgi:hypothetical protein